MTTYILTVNTDALGLGIISGGRVVVERRRTSAAQQYPGFDVLYAITAYTNASGVATLGLKPDDSSVYHEARIYDTSGVVVYRTIFSMLPENIALLEVTEAILGENSIQFKDEGVSLGTPVATNNIDFTGNAVTASFADGTITVNITKPTTAADISAEPAGAVTTHTGAVDPHGDRAYAESYVDTSIAALNTPPNMAASITRGQKFGNHSYIGNSTPVDGPYKGSSSGSTPTSTVALVEALTNRGNIADCACWEMNSNTISTATEVILYAFVSSGGPYPQQQWRTGAKMQFLASLALYNVIPTSENFVYRIGLADVVRSDHRSADPWAGYPSGAGNEHTGCAAMFIADNTSIYWQCKSGYKTSTETTTTSVPYVVGNFDVFHVCVTTTGAVEFRINGTLVATHSGTGIIPDGAYLSEGVAVRNIAATTTAKKGFYLDEFTFRLELPGSRTGFAFT